VTLSGAAVQCRFTRSVPELRWQEQEHWRGTYAHFQRCLVLRLGAIAAVATATFAAAGALWANHPGTDAPLARGTQADLLVVRKSARRLLVYAQGSVVREYRVALGRNPVGPKERVGDYRTPEGWYVIDQHNPNSSFHLSLHVSYPSADDGTRALAAGYQPGGDIMIHGLPNGIGWLGRKRLATDWTDGCIAVSDSQIEELYRLVPDGTPILIRP
jgi:lipoprotein-anchoring transpeptidase ErfK/SrfK